MPVSARRFNVGKASIADTVLAASPVRPRRRMIALAWLIGIGAHAAVFAAAAGLGQPIAARKKAPQSPIEVALEPPPPPEPPPPEPPQPTAAPQRASAPRAVQRAQQPIRAPAQAGQVIARADDAPVDFGDTTFVVGTATAYAGGATTASGTSTRAVERVVAPTSTPARKKPQWTRPVELESEEWQCPWPQEAELMDIERQTVTLRVHVDAEGRATTVTILENPGSGFGAAARACALRTHFTPALDGSGQPVAADSPPIRVRFIR